jgi:hypothetical protein
MNGFSRAIQEFFEKNLQLVFLASKWRKFLKNLAKILLTNKNGD